MNTPAHVVLNAVVLGRGRWRAHWLPVTAGALLPDLPMFGFYFFERVVLGKSERLIWSETYFEPAWQAFFDTFNSFPLIGLGALIAWRMGRTGWLVLFVSMGLHCLADLPVHHDDAHAHFFPLTNWHFRSPVSYWDPRHFGIWMSLAEVLLVLVGAIVLARRGSPRAWRYLGITTCVIYVAFWVFAFAVWIF